MWTNKEWVSFNFFYTFFAKFLCYSKTTKVEQYQLPWFFKSCFCDKPFFPLFFFCFLYELWPHQIHQLCKSDYKPPGSTICFFGNSTHFEGDQACPKNPENVTTTMSCPKKNPKQELSCNIFGLNIKSQWELDVHETLLPFFHEFHENCHSFIFYFMKKDSRQCWDTTMHESIHTKDESKRGSAFAFIFGVNWPVQWM